MKLKITTVLILFIYVTIYGKAQNKSRHVLSGFYSGTIWLDVGYDSIKKTVSGYIEMEKDPKYHGTCQLFFDGVDGGQKEIPITLHQYSVDSSEYYAGSLIRISDTELVIKSKAFFLPCSRIILISDIGDQANLNYTMPYIRIAAINKEKQNLYKSPKIESKSRQYFIKYDPVGIIKETNGWLLVKYIQNEKISGWIPNNSVW